MTWDDKKLSLLRRNSLKNEVDGIWDEFEAVEDGEPLPGKNVVTHGECINLRRVLPENAQDKLPKMCRTVSQEAATCPDGRSLEYLCVCSGSETTPPPPSTLLNYKQCYTRMSLYKTPIPLIPS
eukprot:253889_1